MSDNGNTGDKARRLHDQARDWPVLPATIATVHEAYARRLREFNLRNLMSGAAGDIQLQDPRDILTHALALAGGMKSTGEIPSFALVEALGAQVLALGLSVAMYEDGRPELGDAA